MEPEDFYKKMRQKLDADPPSAPRYEKRLWQRVARELPPVAPNSKWWWAGGALLLLLLNLGLWWRLETKLDALEKEAIPRPETQRIVEVHRDTIYIVYTTAGQTLTAQSQQQAGQLARTQTNAVPQPAPARLGRWGSGSNSPHRPPEGFLTVSSEGNIGTPEKSLQHAGRSLGQFLAAARFGTKTEKATTPEASLLRAELSWTTPDSLQLEKQSLNEALAPKKSLWQRAKQIPKRWQLEAGLQLAGVMPLSGNSHSGGGENGADPHPGFRGGVGLNVLLSERWTLATGLAAAGVGYEFDDDIDERLSRREIERLPQPVSMQGELPEYIEIQNTEISVPLTLRYQLLPESRLRAFVGAGITGRWLLRERFTYGYELEDPDEDEEEYIEETYRRNADESVNWRSLRLEAGLSYVLGRRLGLRSVFFYEPTFRKTGTLQRRIGLGGGQIGLWWRL